MKEKIIIIILIVTLYSPIIATAHPGRTAGDGCHYCRTNCSSWGVAWDQRHCHGGSKIPSPKPAYSTTASCPTNAEYDNETDECVCVTSYALSLNKQYCIKIPENAHSVTSSTDVWLCDSGYEEINNTCIPIKKEEPEITEEIIVPKPILHELPDTKTEIKTEPNIVPGKIEISTKKPKNNIEPITSQTNQYSASETTNNTIYYWLTIIGIGIGGLLYWRYKKNK